MAFGASKWRASQSNDGQELTMMHRHLALFLVVSTSLFAACGGGGEIGEACDVAGSTAPCVEGAVCDTLANGDLVCLELCVEQTDCPDGYDCNGTSGSNLKSCHPQNDAGG
jgi:hypothetical protein